MIRKLLFLLPISIFLFTCKKESSTIEIKNYFWTPIIKVEKGDKEAILNLIDPRPFTEYFIPPADPDYFEIMISENNEDFTLLKKVPITTNEVNIPNLTNGKSYFIVVSSHKKGQDAVLSNKVMTIPSNEYVVNPLLNHIDYSITRATKSKSKSYIAFQSNDLSANTLFYLQLNDNKYEIVESNSTSASWSPNTNKFVYVKNKDIGIYRHNYQFKIYDFQTNGHTVLFEIDYNNFSAFNPQFSFDGTKIIYNSNEGNSESFYYDIWSYDLVTKEKLKHTNFEAERFYILETNHANYPNEIYLSGRYADKTENYGIFRFNINENVFENVIESDWNDIKPALSPDNEMLAFSSDRSGKHELWIYNLISKEYKQITGGTLYHFDNRYTNIQWLNDNEILLTLFKDTVCKLVSIKLE